jgi:hypothetical protein
LLRSCRRLRSPAARFEYRCQYGNTPQPFCAIMR